MRSLVVFILLAWYLPSALSAERYAFSVIDANRGLSGNQVRNITQLPDGRMVITTQGLVNIFDGSAFNYLHYTDKNSIRLSGYSGFHHDYVARKGYMFLKNQYRLYVIDLSKERFADNPKSWLLSWGITQALSDFFMDQEKNFWVITGKDELYYLAEGQKRKQLFLKNISKLSGSHDPVFDLAVAHKKLYLFLRSGMLICFDLATKQELYRQRSLDKNQEQKYAATSFVLPAREQFFQLRNGTGGGIMLGYDLEKRKWRTILQTSYWLNYLSLDKADNLWLTCREGMWLLPPGQGEKEFIPSLKLVDGQVVNTEVSTIYHDSSNGMWLGTLNRGLLYYHPDRFKFKNIGKSLFPLPNGTTLNVSCFAALEGGEVAVGTKQGLFLYDGKTGIIKRHTSGLTLSCNFLLRDSKKRLWIATDQHGLFSLDKSGKLRNYPSSPRRIYSIREDANSSLILSTNEAGFGIFNPEKGTYLQEDASKTSAFRSVIQTADLNQDTMIGINQDGFFIYGRKSGRIKLYPDSRGYNAMLVDSKKQVWLASQDGLHLWNSHTEKTESFFTSHGLINNYIQSIVEAPDGALWVSTAGGLSRLIPVKSRNGRSTYSFTGFNTVDGVIGNEFWERSAYISKDGSIFWGGTDGFNILPAKRAITSRQTHTPLFVNFLLFNKKVESGMAYDDHIVLKDPLPITREIVLNHDQNFFSFEFSALNYINPTLTYYRYQLSGVDEDEQELRSSDGRGRFNYTNVQPGTYYLRVRAADNSKEWTNKYSEIKIIVKAPFWRTGFAYSFYALILIAGSVLSARFYLIKKRKKLVLEQQERLNQMKSAFLQNVNEELSEPLTQIIDPLDNILRHADEGRLKNQLKEIQNNALDLKELVHQLSEGALSPVSPGENDLNMEVLLLNMRRLLELQAERRQQSGNKETTSTQEEFLLSTIDEKLIKRALKFVEDNLDNPNYSVELLSKDMGMDRTGLYRKLVHIIGKTPTSFIRSVRLKRAALLLEEGFTVAEVADRVGFSTSSYLTKCFQEEFGVKPSQYLASSKQRKDAVN